MSYLYLDLETRSELDVTDVGAYVYAVHPSTEILCACFAVDDGPVLMTPTLSGFQVDDNPGFIFVAHNTDFERNVFRAKGYPVDAWTWLDTAALSARMSLPRKLEELAAFFFPDDPAMQKDMEGNAIMKRLSKPRRPSKDNPDKWWTPITKPEEFEKLYRYCAQDVRVMRACHKKLLALEPSEERVRAMTERMNERGVKVDLASVPHAKHFLRNIMEPLAHEFRTITGVPVGSNVKVAEFFRMPDVTKSTVREWLRKPSLAPEVHRALDIKRQLSQSSTSKLDAFLNRTSADGRLRGAFVYCGAERTGRFSSVGVQLQNIRRGLGDLTDDAFHALTQDALCLLLEGKPRDPPEKPLDPVGIIAEMLRGFLVGPFQIGDYSQIEARMIAWMAGEAWLLQSFATPGSDPYCDFASKIYGHKVTKKDKAERFMGKQGILSCGYGAGHRKFRNMLDEIYDVAISEEEAKKVVYTYRSANPKIVAFWDLLDKGFRYVLGNKTPRVKVPRVSVPLAMGYLEHAGVPYFYIELPSGRKLYYARPSVKDDEVRYYGRDITTGRWGFIHGYGGKFAENVTQAASRDVMVEAMLRLEDRGFTLNGTVHDEIIVEKEGKTLDEFRNAMLESSAWCKGLPLGVEVFESNRYRK